MRAVLALERLRAREVFSYENSETSRFHRDEIGGDKRVVKKIRPVRLKELLLVCDTL